jgi:hypothetical protein
MTHATDGLLQAFLDGEIDSPAQAELRDHLDQCAACAAEADALEDMSATVHDALGLLATEDAPMMRAQAALAAARRGGAAVQPATADTPAVPAGATGRLSRMTRLGARSFARAAMLLLALAGAGAAAIPGSPVRRALETTFARVAQFFGASSAPVATDAPVVVPGDAPEVVIGSRMGVLPADGRVRIVLHPPTGEVSITVRLVDGPRAQVETAMDGEGVRFRTGAGRIEVAGLAGGGVVVDIPRTAESATIEIDGLVHVYKRGELLQLSGPAGSGVGEQVRFRLGT